MVGPLSLCDESGSLTTENSRRGVRLFSDVNGWLCQHPIKSCMYQ